MKASELCPSPNMEAAELSGDTVVTIKSVGFKQVGEDKITKGYVQFEEFDRPMILNRTNLKRVIAHHGNETDKWVGKQLTLYPSETDYAGKTVPCIRVRERK